MLIVHRKRFQIFKGLQRTTAAGYERDSSLDNYDSEHVTQTQVSPREYTILHYCNTLDARSFHLIFLQLITMMIQVQYSLTFNWQPACIQLKFWA